MPINRKDIDHVAKLALLDLSDAEKDKMVEQVGEIVGHFARLAELDTKDTPPTSHTLPSVHNVLRPDKPGRTLPQDKAVSQAAESEKGFFKVPRVVES